MFLLSLVLVLGVLAASEPHGQDGTGWAGKKHIVFVLTDDQDVTLDSMLAMPAVSALLANCQDCHNFTNAFVATPICCPSRASYLSGRYTHNHKTYQNSIQHGCSSSEWRTGLEATETYAPHMQAAGYTLGFFGKYLNQYGTPNGGGVAHVPAGWKRWFGLVGNSRYYDYTVSDDGTAVHHGEDYATDYFPDLLKRRAVEFLQQELANRTAAEHPVMAVIHVPSPHRPAQPAPQYADAFAAMKAPRTPNWNGPGTHGKHRFLSDLPLMDDNVTEYSDHIWRRRLRALRSVDDLVKDVVDTVNSSGALTDTVFVFASDHGYHTGQWRVPYCKMLPYEEDIRIPMFIRAVRSSASQATPPQVITAPVLNIDLAPTFLDIAGVAPLPGMDGVSVLPLLGTGDGGAEMQRADFLVEYWPLVDQGTDVQTSGYGADGWCTDGDVRQPEASCPIIRATVDSVNNSWACLRTLNGTENSLFCDFFDGFQLRGDAQPNFVEYYDLQHDPWQLTNSAANLTTDQLASLRHRLEELRQCNGIRCHNL